MIYEQLRRPNLTSIEKEASLNFDHAYRKKSGRHEQLPCVSAIPYRFYARQTNCGSFGSRKHAIRASLWDRCFKNQVLMHSPSALSE